MLRPYCKQLDSSRFMSNDKDAQGVAAQVCQRVHYRQWLLAGCCSRRMPSSASAAPSTATLTRLGPLPACLPVPACGLSLSRKGWYWVPSFLACCYCCVLPGASWLHHQGEQQSPGVDEAEQQSGGSAVRSKAGQPHICAKKREQCANFSFRGVQAEGPELPAAHRRRSCCT
jgi:hypothetical protein